MKEFNLDDALSGKQVVTRSGVIVTELHLFKTLAEYPLVAVIRDSVRLFTLMGKYDKGLVSQHDLFISTEIEKWVNVYKGSGGYYFGSVAYDHKNEAISNAYQTEYIATAKVTFET